MRIDDEHSHCKYCSRAFRNIELTRGYCKACIDTMNEDSDKKLAKASSAIVSKGTRAAATLLANLKDQGKTGQSMPRILGKFMEGIGGEESFADMMRQDFQKARGDGLSTEAEMEAFEYNPKLLQGWYEILMRYQSKIDEGKQLSVDGLEEADLEAIIMSVAMRAVSEDQALRQSVVRSAIADNKFRREIFLTIAKSDRDLVDMLLREGGIITLEQPEPSEYNPEEDQLND